MLQCVVVRCSALQCVAVRCSVLQCVAVCVAVCCSVLQSVSSVSNSISSLVGMFTNSQMSVFNICYVLSISYASSVSSLCIGEVGGWGRDPKKMYEERLGDGVEYHLMSPTPRR